MAGTSRFSIAAVISLKDKLSPGMKRATRSINDFATTANKRINKVAGGAMRGGMLALGAGAAIVAREFVNFDNAIFGATAKMGGLDISTQAGRETMEKLRQTARKVGAETQFSAVQAAQGLEFLAMAGFNAQQSMSLLPGVADLATVANVDFARATDIASDALGAYGLMTTDTTQLSKNFSRVQDVMAATVTKTNTSMEDLFETIKFGAAPFTAAGQAMETFSALAGRMASSGIKGSQAGTTLRSAILRLQKPTKEVTQGLAKFGLNQAAIIKDGKLMDMVDILAKMEKNGKGLNKIQRNSAMAMIFGTRAVSGFAAIMNEGVDKTAKLKGELLASGGAAQKMADIMRQSLGNRIKALMSSLTELGFKIFSAFDGKGRKGIDSLTQAVRNFDVTPIVDTLKVFGFVLKTVFDLVGPFMPLIAGIVIMTKSWAAAQVLVNAAMTANPIALLVTAIASLAMYFVWLNKNMKSVLKRFYELTSFLDKPVFQAMLRAAMPTIMGGAQTANMMIGTRENIKQGNSVARSDRIEMSRLQGRSPESQNITNTNTTNGSLDINIKGNKDAASVKQQGALPPNMALNLGAG